MRAQASCLFPAISFIFMSGCTGHVYTVIKPVFPPEGQRVQGVIVYPPVNVLDVYKTTALIEEGSGKILGTADAKKCVPQNKVKFAVRADFSKPMIVGYEPGVFEKNKFSVTLKDGLLASVNSDSDPSSALKDLAEFMPFVRAPYDKKPAMSEIGEGQVYCNAGETYLGTYLAPEFLPVEKRP
ncbi:hypothetical protein [Thiobacillus sedimenti]|uniref:Lipoprotein n=1 Tax=Thiobacillus sedimenti TaxID=3110231 RepID=A0ABZ1CL55_9PROT|nr:hypothetical protein [Thiobacillus sp. SCUT-2]WRS40108.1 hypothetical protein VA613_04360 [Thiobacillus sp. SCUT-2]